jgi:hypothetical protein
MGGFGSGRSGGRATTDSGVTFTLSKLFRPEYAERHARGDDH